ncbi:MAG: YkgJ family cysteine cluster protein [Nitrososphaerota archaeon]
MKRYIPWTRIKSWSCIACGACCKEFNVILTSYELAKLTRLYGYQIVYISSHGNPCLRKVKDRCIFYNQWGLCSLQPLGLKPTACKMWPFLIRKKPLPDEPAPFVYNGEEYHVYVDTAYPCPGIDAGKPEELYLVITELIELTKGALKIQRYSTARRLAPYPTLALS